jgi:GT2 family glycosyltransferase
MPTVAVIIVTHESGRFLSCCLDSLRGRNRVDQVIVVDAGSRDVTAVRTQALAGGADFIPIANKGFSRANNTGYRHVLTGTDYVLFLNPDAFAGRGALHRALEFMEAPEQENIGCLTGRLLGCDPVSMQTTGRLDSTGIFRRWYGRWYDRGQGESDHGQYDRFEEVPAACGAFMLCRKSALEQVAEGEDNVFDPDFFLYKEDIELSLRLKKHGWGIRYHPGVTVLHCRGWQARKKMSQTMRLQAAASEVLLYRKHPSMYMVWALIKYSAVRFLNV